MTDPPHPLAAAFAAVVLIAGLSGLAVRHPTHRTADVVIGKVHLPVKLPPDPGPPEEDAPALRPDPLLAANGYGPGGALSFRGAVNVPRDLKFFLIIGSDARPGQDMTRTRADSIHIAAVDPLIRKGTVLGLPRDSYVDIPGHGRRKINAALALGGPDLLAQTVRNLTGFPISYYAVTGFDGMVKMVDELHGLDVRVPYRMDDGRYSGARFEPGWHRMDGRQVLAFARNRHAAIGGDFGRSENQGRVIIDALIKLRHETKDVGGIKKWLGVLFSHASLDISLGDAIDLGVLARQIFPGHLINVVAPGASRYAGGQSVVILSDAAYALFRDVGADALADGKQHRETPPPSAAPKPAPTPRPKATLTPSPGATAAPTTSPGPSLLPL